MTALPATMITIAISEPGGPDVLTDIQRPVPAPAPGEVLIEVAAAGVNRPDVMQRRGLYPPPPGASPRRPRCQRRSSPSGATCSTAAG